MKTSLLCTFVHKSDLNLIIDFIQNTYKLDSKMIFVFQDEDKPYQYYCTYNVEGTYNLTANTILIHRKSESNTLYTINALNQIIKNINNGVLDTSIQIMWENYNNTLLLVQDNNIVRIPLQLKRVHKIKNN